MSSSETEDLASLDRLAFRRREKSGDVVRRFHHLPATTRKHPKFPLLERVYKWLFVPFSLWPIDIQGLVELLIDTISTGQPVSNELLFLIGLLSDVPTDNEQKAVIANEHEVQMGNYKSLISAQHKFDLKEERLSQDTSFKADWERFKRLFNVEKFRDKKGIIRRRMALERNFRPEGWELDWESIENRFLVAFDAFCHKWELYGVEYDRPLLQKLSVNVTPLGTMIFIPRYWSFDHKRDLEWSSIVRLHRSREVHRQGVKLSASQLARIKEGKKAIVFREEGKAAGMKGAKLTDYVMAKLKWDKRTDASQLRRLFREAESQ